MSLKRHSDHSALSATAFPVPIHRVKTLFHRWVPLGTADASLLHPLQARRAVADVPLLLPPQAVHPTGTLDCVIARPQDCDDHQCIFRLRTWSYVR